MGANIVKTVAGLAACTESVHHCGREECPYWTEDNCQYLLMLDAIGVIKELTPRLLTLEEALGVDECWFEWKNGPSGYADIVIDSPHGVLDVGIYRILDTTGAAKSSSYGRTWRCWNHRPTVEQRKEAKWDS